ncbi:hypothetical protein J6590_088199 [Homalodisca vitripennis]|nr:hypothetical protein J6590_088199 [Homalodisca vitripennis]
MTYGRYADRVTGINNGYERVENPTTVSKGSQLQKGRKPPRHSVHVSRAYKSRITSATSPFLTVVHIINDGWPIDLPQIEADGGASLYE